MWHSILSFLYMCYLLKQTLFNSCRPLEPSPYPNLLIMSEITHLLHQAEGFLREKQELAIQPDVFMYTLLINGPCVCLQDRNVGMGTWVDCFHTLSFCGMPCLNSQSLRAC